MLDLNFAYFNMMEIKRRGLASRKGFLDRLAPIFFSPRIEKLIDLGGAGLKGCNIHLPLAKENWGILNINKQLELINKMENILLDYTLKGLAVDRKLKNIFGKGQEIPLFYGDVFIKALLIVIIKKEIAIKELKKLILVGDLPGISLLIEELNTFQIPISLQNFHPKRYELMIHRLLYEKGLAVSNSYINPQEWKEEEMVIVFETGYRDFLKMYPLLRCIFLDNNSSGLAPLLEQRLENSGVSKELSKLAPILEACIFFQIFYDDSRFRISPGEETEKEMDVFINYASNLGIWEAFLDKGV